MSSDMHHLSNVTYIMCFSFRVLSSCVLSFSVLTFCVTPSCVLSQCVMSCLPVPSPPVSSLPVSSLPSPLGWKIAPRRPPVAHFEHFWAQSEKSSSQETPRGAFSGFLGHGWKIAPKKPPETNFGHSWALVGKLLAGGLQRLILSISGPWLENVSQEALQAFVYCQWAKWPGTP